MTIAALVWAGCNNDIDPVAPAAPAQQSASEVGLVDAWNGIATQSTSPNALVDVITECNLPQKQWVFQPAQNGGGAVTFENQPISPLLGSGYVKFDCPNQAYIRLSSQRFIGQQLKFISAMSYSTYVVNRESEADNLYIVITVDTDGDKLPDMNLVFNPVYQSGKYVNGGHDQGPILLDTWQTWDCYKGVWWKGPDPSPDDPNNPAKLYTLEKWASMYPKATFEVTQPTQGSIRFTAGSPVFGNNFVGYLDNFRITIKDQETISDFEKCQ